MTADGFLLIFKLGNGETSDLAVDEPPAAATVALWRDRAEEVFAEQGGVKDFVVVPLADVEAEIHARVSALARYARRSL